MKIVDLSVPIVDDLPVDPPRQVAHIKYIDHKEGSRPCWIPSPEVRWTTFRMGAPGPVTKSSSPPTPAPTWMRRIIIIPP